MAVFANPVFEKRFPLLRVLGFFCVLTVFLSCGGEWTSGSGPKISCRFSDVPFSSAKEVSLSADGEAIYVLDIYGSVYSFARNSARVCAFEPARTPENPDARLSVHSAEKIEKVGSFLYYYDGISILRDGDGEWTCDVSLSSMAITASYVYGAASTAGISKLKIGPEGCSKTGTSFAASRVMALDARAETVATVETSGALSDAPERFSVYDADGSLRARTALSSDTASSLFFCSATRLRLGSAFVVLLDAKCGYLGVFDLSGGLLHRLSLFEAGIRNAVDIDVLGDDLYILASSLAVPLYFLDLASYAFGEESM